MHPRRPCFSVMLRSFVMPANRLLRCVVTLMLLCQSFLMNAHASPLPLDDVFVEAANAARRVTLLGPTVVSLADQAELHLPEGLDYTPEPEAGLLLQASGQTADPTLLGLIQPHQSGQWLITVHLDDLGHFTHGPDSPNWADASLLQQLQDATASANTTRRQQGRAEAVVDDWLQCPVLDTQTHRLAWGVALTTTSAARGKAPREIHKLASYTAHVLGREGAITLRMVGPNATHAFDKERLHTILAGIQFLPGRRYEDFQPLSDRQASAPLSVLVGGDSMPVKTRATDSDTPSSWTVVDGAPTRWLVPAALSLLAGISIMAVLGLRHHSRHSLPHWHPTHTSATGFPTELP